MELGLAGRTALVTGAGRGIGLAIVEAFVAEGARVVAVSRRATPRIEELVAAGSVRFVALDLTDADAGERLAAAAGDVVDVLVNNAGTAPARPDGFASITDADWATTMASNLFSAVRVTRALLPKLGAGAAIVNVVSENAQLADPLVMDYSAAKAAELSFTKSLSKELGPRGIRVNAVSPGPVATDLWIGAGGVADTVSSAGGGDPAAVVAGAEQAMPTGRFTQPAEVANVVVALASPAFGNVTGSELVIDGGMRPTM
ncbi:SDR family NAD(P)-dependent oxidoreductase [Agromyces seonyuensis]|uniref:SDR family oxidoreductase n=1 Tax=Agromyces seonyuensis TaxID=2662446 RepID=A0A6I4P0E5_9MICO|nr:SDR family oxidoreductase [Agromyces seonyuensis]MWB98962.1 SDR family oxidoreductase [Agromyces seonyuensis]